MAARTPKKKGAEEAPASPMETWISRARGIGALLGFAIAFWVCRRQGFDMADAALRGLVGAETNQADFQRSATRGVHGGGHYGGDRDGRGEPELPSGGSLREVRPATGEVQRLPLAEFVRVDADARCIGLDAFVARQLRSDVFDAIHEGSPGKRRGSVRESARGSI